MKTSDQLIDELFLLDHNINNFFGTYKYTNKDSSRPDLQVHMQNLRLKRQALEKQLEQTMTILFRPAYYNIYQGDRANWGTRVTVYYIKRTGESVIHKSHSSDDISELVFGLMNTSYMNGWVIEKPEWLDRAEKINSLINKP